MAANKTLYDILGIGKNANGEDIKKAYRVKSKIFHPDKGGDKEIMALLNKAYEILSDPTERNIYDGKWFDVAKDFSDDYDDSNTREAKPTSGSLPAAGDAYSRAFKLLHAKFVEEFRKEPSKQGSASSCLKPFRSTVFSSAEHGAEDLFSFIKANKDSTINLDVQPLTLRTASRYFINFVQGDTDGLYNVCKAFNGKLKELEKAGQQSSFEFQLYSGMYEILLVAYKDKAPDEKILFSLLKITDFATQNIKNTMTFLGPLFQNKHFRDLFSLALHYFWLSEESALNKSYTKNFRGNDKIAELIEKLRSKLSELRACRQSSRSLIEVLQHASVLLELERDLGEDATDLDGDTDWQSSLDELSAVAIKINEKFYREKAFHLLDWLPYLQENAGQRIVVNTLLQIGIAFLKSARIEPDPSVRMADEKVASQLLLLAVQIGHHAEPDIELYACLHGVKCLLSCKYINPHFEQILHGIQARALWLVDFFPFFQPPRSNADVFTGNKKPLYLMRGLLYHLIDRACEQDLQDDAEAPDLYVGGHSLVRVFYHAFEACLKNWYKKKPDPELERQFGRRLMQVLLLSKQWSENDINYNLNAPWPLDDLDEEGWTILRPSILPSARKANIPTLKTLKGFGLDHKTGEISLFLEYNGEDDSDTDRLFTFDDLHELVRGGVTGAAFSLDMADPDMPFHPFNKMRFQPENLYHSRLLHTMFITDYLLKFLTVGQEVQRCDPYDYRSLEQLMARLPDHLKKVIDDFHAHRRGEDRTNRFWIEVEELLFDTDNDESYEEGNVRLFAFGRIRMTVKSCRMERDVEGNLIDKDGENEGWDCYVLSREQEQDLSSGKRVIANSALIIVKDSFELIFWENQRATHNFSLGAEDKPDLVSLIGLERDDQEKVRTDKAAALRQVYRVVIKACKKTAMPHGFSPEFIFAQEFTEYYDEFALHLPEFGRLRELSKAVILVNMMAAQRESNQEAIQRIKKCIAYKQSNDELSSEEKERLYPEEYEYWQNIETKVYGLVKKNVTEKFKKWRQNLSKEKIELDKQAQLNNIRKKVGDLKLTQYSTEVKSDYDESYDAARKHVIEKYGDSTWSEVRSDVIKQLDDLLPTKIKKIQDLKRDAVSKSLSEVFKDEFSGLTSWDKETILYSFFEGNDKPFLERLVRHQRTQIAQDIKNKFFPEHSIETIDTAMNTPLRVYCSNCVRKIILTETKEAVKRHEQTLTAQLEGAQNLEESFIHVGLATDAENFDLDGICDWVPASFRRSARNGYNRTVYGGVSIRAVVRKYANPADLAALKRAYRKPNNEIGIRNMKNRCIGSTWENLHAEMLRYKYGPGYRIQKKTYKTDAGTRFHDNCVVNEETGEVVKIYECKVNTSTYDVQKKIDEWNHQNKKAPKVELARTHFGKWSVGSLGE